MLSRIAKSVVVKKPFRSTRTQQQSGLSNQIFNRMFSESPLVVSVELVSDTM